MTKYEKELLNIISQHPNPEQALEIAIETIVEFLEQDAPSQAQSVSYLPELA